MTLTVYENETGQVLFTLSEDESGIKITGGDPRYVKALKLDQFHTLKDIADYLNVQGSPYQAIFDKPKAEDQPSSTDDRLEPSLKILNDLIQRISERKMREQQSEAQKKPEAEMLSGTDAQVILDPNEQIYVSIDGDGIGNMVARAEENDDERLLSEVSTRINSGQDVLANWALMFAGKVIEAGGDEGLVKVPGSALAQVEQLREQYRQATGATCTAGVGKKISQATKARMLGKLTGKNKTVVFDESTERELELRLQDKDTSEANKMRVAMRPSPGPSGVAQTRQGSAEASEVVAQDEPEDRENLDKEQRQKKTADPQGPALSKSLLEAAKGAATPRLDTGGNAFYDPEIEEADYSQEEDPAFAKSLRYVLKHGGKK